MYFFVIENLLEKCFIKIKEKIDNEDLIFLLFDFYFVIIDY